VHQPRRTLLIHTALKTQKKLSLCHKYSDIANALNELYTRFISEKTTYWQHSEANRGGGAPPSPEYAIDTLNVFLTLTVLLHSTQQ